MTGPDTEKFDAVVVGGGMAGLTAALYLARGGRSVALYEKSSHLGGRAASHERKGYIFNMGVHAIYEKTVGGEILRDLGIPFTFGTPRDLRAIRGGKVYDLPAGPATMLKTRLLSAGGKMEALKALVAIVSAKPSALRGITLSRWLDRNVRRPEVRALLESTVRVITYTNAPEQIDMGLAVEQVQGSTKGKVMYIDGGWQSVVDGMRDAALKAGVHIQTGARVQSIEHCTGGVEGVRLADGSCVMTGAAIIAGSPSEASALVDGGMQLDLKHWAKQSVPVRAACLDVALKRLPNPKITVAVDLDQPRFLTAQSVYAKIAPDGGALVYTIRHIHPDDHPDKAWLERDLESWLDMTQPGWRELEVERQFLPDITISHRLVDAASGGLMSRPGPGVPGIPGLYVVGDWVGHKGLLFGASLASARDAAGVILENHDARLN